MNRLILIAFSCMLFSCVSSGQVIVKVIPPAPVVKLAPPPKPAPHHVWIDGHWVWNKRLHQYVWKEGYWSKPKKGHHWVPGHWADVPGGHKWIPGHWAR